VNVKRNKNEMMKCAHVSVKGGREGYKKQTQLK
jgi:hypothetical protein